MDNNKQYSNLPKHTPKKELWSIISSKLDEMQFDEVLENSKKNLPIHKPKANAWAIIQKSISNRVMLSNLQKYSIAVAACLLLFVAVRFMINNENSEITKTELVDNNKSEVKDDKIEEINNIQTENFEINLAYADNNLSKKPNSNYSSNINKYDDNYLDKLLNTFDVEEDIRTFDFDFNKYITTLNFEINNKNYIDRIEKQLDLYAINQTEQFEILASNNTKSILFEEENINKSTKYYTYDGISDQRGNSEFALGVNYLPEQIYNGFSQSLFHNIDLNASFEKEKVKFMANVGLAVNNEDYKIGVDYESLQPITVNGPNETLDTVGFRVTNMHSNLNFEKQNQYFTSSFGFGRKILEIGKFSSWINTLAGFAVMTTSTNDENSDSFGFGKNQPLISVNSTTIEAPTYNPYYVNMLLGIDLNYAILDRLTFSVSPVGRWFFKPVFEIQNQPTDELSLGIKTGLRFNF